MSAQDYIEARLTKWDRIKGQAFYVLGFSLLADIGISMLVGRDALTRIDVGIFCILLPVVVWGNISATQKVAKLRKEYEDGKIQ